MRRIGKERKEAEKKAKHKAEDQAKSKAEAEEKSPFFIICTNIKLRKTQHLKVVSENYRLKKTNNYPSAGDIFEFLKSFLHFLKNVRLITRLKGAKGV